MILIIKKYKKIGGFFIFLRIKYVYVCIIYVFFILIILKIIKTWYNKIRKYIFGVINMARRKKRSNMHILIIFILFIIFVMYLLYNFDNKGSNVVSKNATNKGTKINRNNTKKNNKTTIEEKTENNSISKEEVEEPKTEEEQNKIEEETKSSNLDVSSIELNGDENIILSINEKFNDPGAKAYNKSGEDISDNIKVESNLDISKKGEYTITYSVGKYIVVRFITVK